MAYDEHRLMDPMFQILRNDRNKSGMLHCWGMIQQACNKWHGIQEEICRHPQSGTNIADQVSQPSLYLSVHCVCVEHAKFVHIAL
jgi:hypothetical protein